MKGSKVKYIRFPVLFIVLATMALTCAIYVSVHGSTYTAEQINQVFNDYKNIELSAKSKDENIIAVEKVYFNDNHLICVDVHSVNPGDTEVTVLTHYKNTASDNYDYRISVPFHVNFMGTVIQADYLNFDGFLIIQYFYLFDFAFFECYFVQSPGTCAVCSISAFNNLFVRCHFNCF